MGADAVHMSRTEKLQARLDALCCEFRKLLAKEFEEISRGAYSSFVWRHTGPVPEGRSRRNAHVAHMEELEAEITQLGKKLGLDASTLPTRYVREFVSASEAAGLKFFDGQHRALAKRLLAEVQAEI